MALKYLLIACLAIGTTLSQELSISNATSYLPPELQGKITEGQVAEVQNKTIELLQKKCETHGGPSAFENVKKSATDLMSCLKELVDTDQLQKEVEAAKKNGTVDEVFKTYCDKTPSFKACLKDMADSVKSCVSADEKKHVNTLYNITETLAQFACFKDGDRIALFIAEGGPECIEAKKDNIQQCVNSTLGTHYQLDMDSLDVNQITIPDISFEEKDCTALGNLRDCVVKSLEKCDQPTTANIVDSLFKFAIKTTPCKNFENRKPNSANNVFVVTTTVLLGLVAAVMV